MKFWPGLPAAAFVAAAFCSGCSSNMQVSGASLMSGAQISQGRRGETKDFHLNDRIIQMVDFTWTDPLQDAGIHRCEWKWYRDGKLVSDTPAKRLYFATTPFTLRTARPAAPLGVGSYTVDTIVDGNVVAVSTFTISA